MAEVISDEEHILRRVPFLWIREDGTILEYAYKPVFPRDDDGVSVGMKNKIDSNLKLRKFNFGRQKNPKANCVCQLIIKTVRDLEYDVAQKPHDDKLGLIVGDMKKLESHHEALITFADNSEIVFNHPYESW